MAPSYYAKPNDSTNVYGTTNLCLLLRDPLY